LADPLVEELLQPGSGPPEHALEKQLSAAAGGSDHFRLITLLMRQPQPAHQRIQRIDETNFRASDPAVPDSVTPKGTPVLSQPHAPRFLGWIHEEELTGLELVVKFAITRGQKPVMQRAGPYSRRTGP